MKLSSIEGLCLSSFPEPEQSATLGHHISQASFTHFSTSSLSGYSWSCSLVWKPCLSTLHSGSRHLAGVSWLQLQAPAGPKDIFQAQENPHRFVMPKACWHKLFRFAPQLTMSDFIKILGKEPNAKADTT